MFSLSGIQLRLYHRGYRLAYFTSIVASDTITNEFHINTSCIYNEFFGTDLYYSATFLHSAFKMSSLTDGLRCGLLLHVRWRASILALRSFRFPYFDLPFVHIMNTSNMAAHGLVLSSMS